MKSFVLLFAIIFGLVFTGCSKSSDSASQPATPTGPKDDPVKDAQNKLIAQVVAPAAFSIMLFQSKDDLNFQPGSQRISVAEILASKGGQISFEKTFCLTLNQKLKPTLFEIEIPSPVNSSDEMTLQFTYSADIGGYFFSDDNTTLMVDETMKADLQWSTVSKKVQGVAHVESKLQDGTGANETAGLYVYHKDADGMTYYILVSARQASISHGTPDELNPECQQ